MIILSAMPCSLPPITRLEDETKMVESFVALQAPHGSSSSASMSSEVMQQGLRMYGLFNFTSPSSDPVSGFKTVAPPVNCHSLVPLVCSYVCAFRVSVCLCVYTRAHFHASRAICLQYHHVYISSTHVSFMCSYMTCIYVTYPTHICRRGDRGAVPIAHVVVTGDTLRLLVLCHGMNVHA